MSDLHSGNAKGLARLENVFKRFDPPVLFAYLFGSTGTPSETSGSDLDIAVYFDLPEEDFELDHKFRLYADLSRTTGRNDIDLLVLNTCENMILLHEVLTQGRLLYDTHRDRRLLYEQKTLHMAIDFKEHRKRIFGW